MNEMTNAAGIGFCLTLVAGTIGFLAIHGSVSSPNPDPAPTPNVTATTPHHPYRSRAVQAQEEGGKIPVFVDCLTTNDSIGADVCSGLREDIAESSTYSLADATAPATIMLVSTIIGDENASVPASAMSVTFVMNGKYVTSEVELVGDLRADSTARRIADELHESFPEAR